ncbi:uncharacterized protein LOC125251189 [Megalobrama amblycephala]|uniref:uncharacterized protein LOC125251189 n=1 Tax=Megalobrama amblycephala TaxID=75352 RepID=UPI0020143888|nr:uncharacterized protein LOC125251189 [Megalobrama amblycephala]
MGAMRLCFLLFCLFLVSVSSVRKLNNIDDLRNSGYGRPRPRHGLQLIFWFAQRVVVDQNNNRFSLNFNPIEDVYGFHLFRNREVILPSLSSRQSYYSVGNLNYRHANALPEYVRRFYRNNNLPERNMDRLMISLEENSSYRTSRVFVTAHNRNRNDFNSLETYEIDPALILQIRQTYPCNNYVISSTSNHDDEDDYTEEERCSQFLTATGYSSNTCKNPNNRRKKRSPYPQCNAYEEIKLQIKTTTQGYSKLIWENVPADIMKNHKYVYIDICQNTYSSDPNQEPTQVRKTSFLIHESSGALDTSVSLNDGLQPRLRLYTSRSNYYFTEPYFWYGPEFDGANKVIPIRIKGFDASLQLYAKHGKACARLYIKKTFSDWKNVLSYSWVGFYKNSQDKNDGYDTYQYAVNFAMIDNTTIKNYDIYQYDSSLAMAPGVQIRFLLDKKYNKVLARTTPWERDEKVTSVCDKGNLQPKPSSTWSYPEFFYEPEFYDANNVLPIKIQNDAGLQLFTKDGKACARLYIKKSFTDWKTTFYYSWVGFYTSSQEAHKYYSTYQYAVNFEKMGDSTKNFDVYQFKSELAIAPGVQIRFLMDKSYDKKLVETEPWKSG